MKNLLARLTPSGIVGLLTAVLAVAAAFGLPLTQSQSSSILVFGGSVSLILFAHGLTNALHYLTPPTLTGLVGTVIGIAIAFGAPITAAQSSAVLTLTGLLAGLLLVHGVVHTLARDRRLPQPSASSSITEVVSRSFHGEADGERVGRTRRKKGGRLPGYVPAGLKTFLEYATKRATAPATWPVPAGGYPIDNNDVEGDCTIAGGAHLLQAWNRLFGQRISIPVPATIRKIYRTLTGGGDTGLVEADVLRHWKASGLFTTADKIFGYAPIKITDHNAIKLAVARYGGAYLGIVVGQPQEEQFGNGQPWEWVPGQEREGHCVVGLGYTKDGLLCATWGGIALLTWAYLEKALEEAWVILPKALVKAGKDTLGLDLAQLERDLAKGLS